MDTKIAQTAIIYNKQNLAAVIAAAIALTNNPDSQAYDVGQLVSDEHDNYFWIGVEPRKNIAEFYHRTRMKQHTVIVEPAPVEPLAIQLHPFKTKYPEIEEKKEDIFGFHPTLIGLTCRELLLANEEYCKLDFQVSHFYEKSLEIEYLALVYVNLQAAEQAIINGTPYQVKATTDKDIKNYLHDIQKVKTSFNYGYKHTKVQDGSKVRIAVHTSNSDFSFHLALRLTRLVHRNFLNMTMGMSGVIAYTNMRHIVFDEEYGRPLVLN